MAVFIVEMVHPESDGLDAHLAQHVAYLKRLLASGTLKASGPLKGPGPKTGLLVMEAVDRAAVEDIVGSDPFAVEGLILELSIREWDPLFGVLHDSSSRRLPGSEETIVQGRSPS